MEPTTIISDNTDADLIRIFSLAGMLRSAGYTIRLDSDTAETVLRTDAPADVADRMINSVNRGI